MAMIGLIHDAVFLEHKPGIYHCESPNRLEVIAQALVNWPGFKQCQIFPLRSAKEDELLRVHTLAHLARIAATAGRNFSLDTDTFTSPRSYEIALLAVGSLIDLCDAAFRQEISAGIALIRPPGHHATSDRAMGFCLFNNVAVAAAYLLSQRKVQRILIIDWDVHHGNGTEDIFFRSKNVFYFSIHQSPFYPGTGSLKSIGSGEGEGYNLNVPMVASQNDYVYLYIFEKLLVPIARCFQPEFILVSAGFDCHANDPLGGMQITEAGFAGMATIVNELAQEFCPGKLVISLEGGYNPTALARSMLAVLDALGPGFPKANIARKASREILPPSVVKHGLEIMNKYWSCLSL